MLHLLHQAAEVALPSSDIDYRDYWLGAVGVREDGVLVSAKNGAASFRTTIKSYELLPTSHAEGRILRKLGKGGTIFVARVSKKDGSLVMAMPCPMCQIRIRSFKVPKVYYTINSQQYGIWDVKKDSHRVCDW